MTGAVSPWFVLGIEPGASPAVVRAAYRRAVRTHHPDGQGAGDVEALMAAQAAYQELIAQHLQQHSLRHSPQGAAISDDESENTPVPHPERGRRYVDQDDPVTTIFAAEPDLPAAPTTRPTPYDHIPRVHPVAPIIAACGVAARTPLQGWLPYDLPAATIVALAAAAALTAALSTPRQGRLEIAAAIGLAIGFWELTLTAIAPAIAVLSIIKAKRTPGDEAGQRRKAEW